MDTSLANQDRMLLERMDRSAAAAQQAADRRRPSELGRTMGYRALWLAGIFGALAICHDAKADDADKRFTAKDLVATCSGSRGARGDMFCVGFLVGLETGLIQGRDLMQQGWACMSKPVAAEKLAQIVKSYVEQHSDVSEIDARDVALAAIGFAFPCPGTAPPTNIADVCARRCAFTPSKPTSPETIATGLPIAVETCLRTCGEELGRTAR